MSYRFCRVQSTMLRVAVFMAAAYTFIATAAANTGSSDGTFRTTIAKGVFVTPSETTGIPRLPTTPMDMAQTSKSAGDEIFARVSAAPTNKSRTIAELRNGQAIKILKTKNNWLKITWQIDDTLSQGWVKKTLVEGTTIHAHR